MNCETPAFEEEWARLVAHVKERASHLVLLPEMGFAPWFAAKRTYEETTWQRAVLSEAERAKRTYPRYAI